MRKVNRRSFLRRVSSGVAAGMAPAFLSRKSLGQEAKLQVGVIGLKGIGFPLARSFINTGRANILAACDVDEDVLDQRIQDIAFYNGSAPERYTDFRDILENDQIDAVIVATPDHWHAIQAVMACEAQKDVYLEKPAAHNVHECRVLAQAAQQYNRIVQQGTQQRSGVHFQEAKEYIEQGHLGKIALVRNWGILGRDDIGNKEDSPEPDYVDYDFWLGPAPQRPFNENRFHYNWRFFWEYGTGDMGNWGVHWIDTSLWTLDLGWPLSVSSTGGKFIYEDDKETPDTQVTTYEYPHLTMTWELRQWSNYTPDGRNVGTGFYGEEQTLIINRDGWKAYSKEGSQVVEESTASNDMLLDHAHDFIDAVESRQPPVADIASGHISAAVAIMGNVALKAKERIVYDPEADSLNREDLNHLLTREYREPWTLPKVGNSINSWSRIK